MSGSKLSIILAACLHSVLVLSMVSSGRDGHGLIGYGISMYKPLCAYTCRDVLSSSTLDCSEHMHMSHDMHMGMGASTSPECYATDDAFLSSLAYCISTHCHNVSVWELEKYWTMNVAGKQPDQPLPKATYQQTLANITAAPKDTLIMSEDLNRTMIVPNEDYQSSFNAQGLFEKMERRHETYGYVPFAPSGAGGNRADSNQPSTASS